MEIPCDCERAPCIDQNLLAAPRGELSSRAYRSRLTEGQSVSFGWKVWKLTTVVLP